MRKHALISATALGVAVALATAGCSVSAKDSDDGSPGSRVSTGSTSGAGPTSGGDVVLVTHDSWYLPKKLIAQFEQQTGYHLVVRASGDAGKLTNKLVLTQSNPDGDVSFGVDNTFASRALKANVFAPYTPANLPAGVSAYDVEATPVRTSPRSTTPTSVSTSTPPGSRPITSRRRRRSTT